MHGPIDKDLSRLKSLGALLKNRSLRRLVFGHFILTMEFCCEVAHALASGTAVRILESQQQRYSPLCRPSNVLAQQHGATTLHR